MTENVTVGCLWCAHPSGPCLGESCDHYQPTRPSLKYVMEDERRAHESIEDEDYF